MLEGIHDNIMYFANDSDFAEFCLNPNPVLHEITTPAGVVLCNDYSFTDAYLNSLAQGIKFCIQDEKSHVNKDGILGYRDCNKRIDNIERYYGED